MPSDVQVFVRFKDQSVFAGEELNCVITFKNVAEQLEPPTPGGTTFRHTKRNSINQLAAAQAAAGLNNARKAGELHQRDARSPSTGPGERSRAKHQGSFSISTPATPILRGPSPSNDAVPRPAHQHQRSVSIISASPVLPQDVSNGRPKMLGHRRSSTMNATGKHKACHCCS